MVLRNLQKASLGFSFSARFHDRYVYPCFATSTKNQDNAEARCTLRFYVLGKLYRGVCVLGKLYRGVREQCTTCAACNASEENAAALCT